MSFLRRSALAAALVLLGSCTHVPVACTTAEPVKFAEKVRTGLGNESFWFTAAVARIPWEGKAGIASTNVLHRPDDPDRVVLPLEVAIAPDCAVSAPSVEQMKRDRIVEISGRGRFASNGQFVVDCICSVQKIDGLTSAQAGALQVFP